MKILSLISYAFAAVFEVKVTPNGFEQSTIELRVGDSLILRGSKDLPQYHVRQISSTSQCGPKQGNLDYDDQNFSAGHTLYHTFEEGGSYVVASGTGSNFCSYLNIKVAELPHVVEMDMNQVKALMAEYGNGFALKVSSLVLLPLLTMLI